MGNRLELQTKLEELLSSRHVYYQPPESLKMEYPAIKYSKSKIESRHANDKKYSKFTRYEIIVIDRKPDNPIIQKILEMPYSSYDRYYAAENLNHDVINLYF